MKGSKKALRGVTLSVAVLLGGGLYFGSGNLFETSASAEESSEAVHVEYVMTASDLTNTSKRMTADWITRNSTYDKVGSALTLSGDGSYVTAAAENGDPQLWYYDSLQKIKSLPDVEITYRLKSAPANTIGRFYFFNESGAVAAQTDVKNYVVGDQWNTIKITLPEAALTDEVINIRFDYLEAPNEGDSIDIQSIKFSGDVVYEELIESGYNTNANAQFDYSFDSINGAGTDGTNNKLNGWTYATKAPTDFVLNGWIVVKSDNGSVGIDHYEYRIDDGAWTAIEGGITERNMWFSDGYIPNGKYDQKTAGISNLTVPAAALTGHGTYALSLRAVTTNYKTVTMRWTYVLEHTGEYTAAVAPACTEDGHAEYWYCAACEKYFTDEACTQETTLEALRIEKTGHTAEHVEAVASTCAEEGHAEYWYCSVCGKYFADEECTQETTLEALKIAKTGHTAEYVEAVASTCAEEGHAEYWYCSVCGKYFADEECTQETTLGALKTEKADHEIGDWIIDIEPTETTDGSKHRECNICHEKLAEEVIPATGGSSGGDSSDGASSGSSDDAVSVPGNGCGSAVGGFGITLAAIGACGVLLTKKRRK